MLQAVALPAQNIWRPILWLSECKSILFRILPVKAQNDKIC